MREILFRAKRFPYHEWIQGYYLQKTAESGEVYHCMVATDGYLYDVDPNTVGEFTGFLDVNGNKIFSGDIVSTKYGRLCGVSWFKSQAFNGWNFRPIECEHKAPDEFDLWSNLTVVGNKWDNPELLNEDVRDGT